MRKMFFAPAEPSPLCNGLTEGQNRGKLCTNRECGVSKHTKNLFVALLTNHAYLTLPGSGLIHPFPVFKYKVFATDTITKLKETSLTYNKSTNIRYTSKNIQEYTMEEEVKILLLVSQETNCPPPP